MILTLWFELIIGVFVIVELGAFSSFPHVNGSINNASVYTVESKPYGLPYGQWTAKWWQWVLSISTKDNPVVEETGVKFLLVEKLTFFLSLLEIEKRLILVLVY